MTADTDLYGISGFQCGNDTEPEYDHEETDSQDFQDSYRAARLAEEQASLLGGKSASFSPLPNLTKIKEKFMPANYPYRFRQSVATTQIIG